MSFKKIKKTGTTILGVIGGIILGILCCPCMCMIVHEEKMRNKNPKYRRERRARQREELKKCSNSH